MPDVVLFSGGMDSLYVLRQRAPADAIPLFICYGQRHLRFERRAAATLAHDLVERTITIPWRGSALTGGDSSSWIVPNRNAILASIGAAEAQARGGKRVWIGCCADDAEGFPDCRPAFIEALSRALELSCGVVIMAPLLHMTKADILRAARNGLREELERTWSCYDPQGGAPCELCGACLARARGFAEE